MKEKDPNKVKAIFEATINLFAKVGLSGLKMSEIAKEASIASGTIYIYFDSKEKLLNELYKDSKQNWEKLISERLVNKQLPLKTRFKAIWEEGLKFRTFEYNKMVFMEQFTNSPFISEDTKVFSNKSIQPIYNILNEGKESLILKDLDNTILLCLVYGLLKEISFYCQSDNLKLTKELIDSTFLLCWDALKA
ncbi:MAG: TetR/AcrR family transcriptional regulator [Cyanobacteriota bacterium]